MESSSVTIERVEPLLQDAEAADGVSGSLTLANGITLQLGESAVSLVTPKKPEEAFAAADLLGISALAEGPCLVLHAAPRKRSGFFCSGSALAARTRVDRTLPCESYEQAVSIRTSLAAKLLGTDATSAQKPWLVLINPFGGGGKAVRVWTALQKLLAPLDLQFEVTRTTHAGHAQELGENLTIGAYRGVVSVSGDGLVYEFVNGLMSRPDAAAAAAATPILPVPGGSANGLFRSIAARSGEKDDLLGAAMIIARGHAVALDLWEYVRPDPALLTGPPSAAPGAPPHPAAAATTDPEAGGGTSAPNERVCWSFLSFAWGIVSDVDIESEVLRNLGSLRFTLWAIWRVLTLRKYAATLHYLDAGTGAWSSFSSTRFVGVWACNVPYMSQTDYVAPQAEFDNGVLDMLVLADTTRWQALDMFLSIEEGTHLGKKGLQLLKVKAFRIEPAPRTPSSPGILDIDGELVPFGPIEAKPHPAALRVLSL